MKQRIYEGKMQGVGIGGTGPSSLPGWQRGPSDRGRELLSAFVDMGEKINDVLAREYRQRRTAEVDDLVLTVGSDFEKWKAEYNRANQGRLGLDAATAYREKFEELAKAAQENLEAPEHEIYPDMLRRRLAERGLFAMRDGLQFEQRQRELWLGSQLEAQGQELESYAASHPEDRDGINFKRARYLEKLAEFRPGVDLAPLVAKLDRRTLQAQLSAMQLNDDYEGMERLLSARSRLLEAGLTEKSPLGSWAAAHNNPGDVKTDASHMAMFGSRAEGIAAVMERAQSYARKGRDTISKIMHTYAPDTENDTEAYIRNICKATGRGPHEKVDTSDPVFLKAFARAIIRHENSLETDDADLDAGYEWLARNGKPKAIGRIPVAPEGRRALLRAGIPPEELARWQKVIESGRERLGFLQMQGRAEQLWKDLQALPADRRQAAFYEATASLPIDERQKLARMLAPEISAGEDYEKRKLQERVDDGLAESLAADAASLPGLIEGMTRDLSTSQQLQVRRSLMAARRENEEEERRQWAFAWQGMLDRSLEEVADQSQASQEARLNGVVAAIAKNSDDADQMLQYGRRWLERTNGARNAREAALVEQIAQQAENPEQIRQLLNEALKNGELSGQGMKRAQDALLGPASAENRENSEALARAKKIVSAGGLASEAARREYAIASRLTLAQEKELLAFQGYAANSVYGRIESIARQLGYADMPPREIESLMRALPIDHEPTDRDLREIVKAGITKSTSWFRADRLVSSMAEAEPDLTDWLPELEDHEEPELVNILKMLGYPPNSENMRILKKQRLAKTLGLNVTDQLIK